MDLELESESAGDGGCVVIRPEKLPVVIEVGGKPFAEDYRKSGSKMQIVPADLRTRDAEASPGPARQLTADRRGDIPVFVFPFQAKLRSNDGGPDFPVVGRFHAKGADDGFGMLGTHGERRQGA